ncbi:formate dehydrogenase-N subunit alpha [Desulfuribacillus stibiiarsenatis]|nr:formate dehydrogenase-N subunit alpha [Desulfuribacillus stibiiarsenatis]
MTNHWVDFKNADVIFIIGGNPAENHPISWKWIEEAQRTRGAKIVTVDPRFTRSAARSDVYAPMRSGTDIPFIFGLMKYIIDNGLEHRDYVLKYTNSSFIINDEYEFNDGLFSGYDAAGRKYANASWAYKKDEEGNVIKDETLQDPRCVWQLLKKHLERYDVDTVCSVTGTPKEDYLAVAEIVCSTGSGDRSGNINYAMGTTQHTVGSQNVRSYAMLQLLLGNMGLPGGGVNALRGEANVQGSTDFALLFHILPGYLPAPTGTPLHENLEAYNKTTPGGYWTNRPKFMASLLKAWWGDYATPENDFSYDFLPKSYGNHSFISIFEAMYEGTIKGLICWGQNPMVGGPNSNKERAAMANLDWLVSIDLYETETAAFWQDNDGSQAKSADINTEVFFLPANAPMEKEGTVSNSGRWMQYRWKAVSPREGVHSKSDLFIANDLGLRIKKLYEGSTAAKDIPIQKLTWNYSAGIGEYPNIQRIAKEINGYNVETGKTVGLFGELQADGTTACGNWIYSGCYTKDVDVTTDQENDQFYKDYKACRRDDTDLGPDGKEGIGSYLNWSYAWPANRRILYNRCSADWNGNSWSKDKASIWWNGEKWAGYDVPDFVGTRAPQDPGGMNPFIMMNDGVGALFAPTGMVDGPFPEHYEPLESPIPNAFNSVELNPAVHIYDSSMNEVCSRDVYPIVATTYRMCEHWQSGVMTRNLAWLSELVPHMFVELSEELAAAKQIKNGEQVEVFNERGVVKAVAMVTKRFKPFNIRGQEVHQIGMPWHFGYKGIVTGHQANLLTSHIGCANTRIPEYKAFLCDVRRA